MTLWLCGEGAAFGRDDVCLGLGGGRAKRGRGDVISGGSCRLKSGEYSGFCGLCWCDRLALRSGFF